MTCDDPSTPRILLKGVLDEVSIEVLQEAAEKSLEQPVKRLVLDMRDLTFISSAGLTVLMKLQKRLAGSGAEFVLAFPRPAISRILKLTQLDRVIIIQHDPANSPIEKS